MARKESKEGVKPLLYIAQPDFQEAKLNIQHSYVVKVNNYDQKQKDKEYVASKYEVEELEELEVQDLEEQEELEDVVNLDELEEQQEEQQEELEEEQVEADNAWMKKPFKAMTNEEKVLFMINKPHYIPKVECRIRTDKDLYIGYIMGYNDGKVSIKVSSKINDIELDIQSIVSIQMVGI
ncbi:CotO family spore coat protein [Gottfriedia acidiceleris]|uniref:CotO family spore coat protein n=1 Tax=Gottfriedia acidiceleris TaxID=371036 RepID=UPI000B4412D4|nr:CotO family spore coat protein [Gottfriedia acidiceleris]